MVSSVLLQGTCPCCCVTVLAQVLLVAYFLSLQGRQNHWWFSKLFKHEMFQAFFWELSHSGYVCSCWLNKVLTVFEIEIEKQQRLLYLLVLVHVPPMALSLCRLWLWTVPGCWKPTIMPPMEWFMSLTKSLPPPPTPSSRSLRLRTAWKPFGWVSTWVLQVSLKMLSELSWRALPVSWAMTLEVLMESLYQCSSFCFRKRSVCYQCK